MPDSLAAPVVKWIEHSFDPPARVANVELLVTSETQKHVIDVDLQDGRKSRLVLRRYHQASRLAGDPWYDPANEALALRHLADQPVPAPLLHAADLEGLVTEVPAILESWIPGTPAWQPDALDRCLARAAEVLVAIHEVSAPYGTSLKRYAPYEDPKRLVSPPFSTRSGLWERVVAALDASWPQHQATFIHRDYHPWNILWDGERVTGVIDWMTAAWGPPGIDLAHMRVNLASHLGRGAADRFAEAYVSAGGDPRARHPYWDLLDAAGLVRDFTAPTAPDGGDLARLEDYVEHVLAELEPSR